MLLSSEKGYINCPGLQSSVFTQLIWLRFARGSSALQASFHSHTPGPTSGSVLAFLEEYPHTAICEFCLFINKP